MTDINEKHRPDEYFNMLPLLVELGLDVDSTAELDANALSVAWTVLLKDE